MTQNEIDRITYDTMCVFAFDTISLIFSLLATGATPTDVSKAFGWRTGIQAEAAARHILAERKTKCANGWEWKMPSMG